MTKLNQTDATHNQETAKDEDLKNRRIRSFVLRQGRVTKGQERALETGLPKFGVSYAIKPLDLNRIFSRQNLLAEGEFVRYQACYQKCCMDCISLVSLIC